MPTVTPTIVPMATVSELEDESETGEPFFTLMDVLLYGLSFLDGRFLNRKKGPRPLA
jgi:hypothetical protein